MSSPFFSIAITTYQRQDLLREALDSILSQDFDDVEVIVGNDFQGEVLTDELLGISDPRVRIINHPVNLREVGNMNALLEAAQGRYFTWLFDDDLYEPGFLRAAHATLQERGFPAVLFPSYRVVRGKAATLTGRVPPGRISEFDGRTYLQNYFAGRARLISTCGLFDTAALRRMSGGVVPLTSAPIGLYSEFFLLVQCARFERIVFMDAPYVVFRAHAGSWGESNTEIQTYLEAGEQLVRRSAAVLHQLPLRGDFYRDLIGVCKIHLATFCFAAVRSERAAGERGPRAIAGALRRVSREVGRQRQIVASAGPATNELLLRLRFLPVAAKCLYLVLFAFVYYRWRGWRGEGCG